MLIVVEGPDGSGKTSLIQRARQEITGKYFNIISHSCRPLYPWQISEAVAILPAYAQTPTLLDRHPLISEPIYGPILRGESLVPGQWKDPILRRNYLGMTVSRLIYCRPPADQILRNLNSRPQLAGVRECLESLIRAYDNEIQVLGEGGIPIIHYNHLMENGIDLPSLLFGV